jgi:hypothetical protein
MLAARVALAQEPTATGPTPPAAPVADGEMPPSLRPNPKWRPPPPPPEIGLGLLQLVVGPVAMLGTVVATNALFDVHEGLGFASLTLGPAVGGLIVCGIGGMSRDYDGSCTGPVAGAYLGALTAIPLALFGCWLDAPDADSGCAEGATLGFAAGYLVGTAVGATIGWHLGKRLRDAQLALGQPRPGVLSAAWLELQRRRTSSSDRGGKPVAVPVLQLSF